MRDDTISRAAAIEVMRKAKDKSEAHRMLIQLPSAQPVNIAKLQPNCNQVASDCISRQAAINAICEDGTRLERQGQYSMTMVERKQRDADILEALPSAQRWIPWDSGRFPEESGTYIVTAYDGAKRRVTYAKYQKRLKRWELTGARAYWRVLAWMPHIEPWEGEQDE